MYRDRTLHRLALFLLLAISLVACGGGGGMGAAAMATPGTSSDQAGTGPRGLPLYCPLSVAVDRQDAVYVSDNDDSAVHERIIKLSPTGQALGEWHPFPPANLALR
jgi:predicted small lipoprotein YifL